MSNSNEIEPEIKLAGASDSEELGADLRVDDLKAAATVPPVKSFVKPTLHVDNSEGGVTPQQVIAFSKAAEQAVREAIRTAKFDGALPGQVVSKSVAPITDFSKMTLDDVYDLSVPIEAKAFMSADVLAIKLKDTNYEARWVNKNPQRLGEMIGKGFTYIAPNDLVAVEGIQTGTDAEGHYCFNDVVAMKIDKATYFRALRAAHERAVSTTNETQLRTRAAKTANSFMGQSEVGSDFGNAQASGKMKFYDPDNSGIAI